MRLIQQFERLESMHHLIKLKATGSPKDFAQRLNISKSTLFEYLQTLKEMGGRLLTLVYYDLIIIKKIDEFQIGFTTLKSTQIKGGVPFSYSFRKKIGVSLTNIAIH